MDQKVYDYTQILEFHFIDMNKIRYILFLVLVFSACAPQTYRFADKEPVMYYNDISPIPLPKTVFKNRFEYYANVLAPKPVVESFFIAPNNQARDVNSMDQVPASSWYIPRLGYQEITPEELAKGPTEFGPPAPPLTVIRVRKADTTPRLFIKDSNGNHYMLKMDPKGHPAIATSTSFIVNRLFWGFGYNVPEDQLFYFERKDLQIDSTSDLDESSLDKILSRTAVPENGFFRSIASRIIEGLPMGPSPSKGVRHEDANDLFPHEERRILRALRVFASFTNMSEIGSDNLFDIYVGEQNKGYVKHYMIDFDDAFGTFATRSNKLWAGFNHNFSLNDIFLNFFTMGLLVQDWEKASYTPWPSVGTFEATLFKPEKWKESHPFDPIQYSQTNDNYWAAKILSNVTIDHLKALVDSAHYPDKAAAQYMLATLESRKTKVLKYYLNQVTPLEFVKIKNDTLVLKDIAFEIVDNQDSQYYQLNIKDDANSILSNNTLYQVNNDEILIPLSSEMFAQTDNYLIANISKLHYKDYLPSAEFHIIKRENGEIKLVGVTH